MLNIKNYLKRVSEGCRHSQIKDVDAIYLINLDQRPIRFQKCLDKLGRFGIKPLRVPAIYGWGLEKEEFQEIGLIFKPGMDSGHSKKYRAVLSPLTFREQPLDASCYGQACFHPRMTPGGIGCALSHLSALKDALDHEYQTIWILEDDIQIKDDPRQVTEYMDLLDKETQGDWDILYTDHRAYFEPFTPGTVWRPDLPNLQFESLFACEEIGSHFCRIGGRCQAHSMILKRDAIEKIYEFETSRGLFMPYDVEISFAASLKCFNLKNELIWAERGVSDTDQRHFL